MFNKKEGIIDFYKSVEGKISDNITSIEKLIQKDITDFTNYYASNPICAPRFIFAEDTMNKIINLLGFEIKDFVLEIKKRSFNDKFKVMNDKNNVLMLFIIRFYMETYRKEKAKIVSNLLMYRLFSALMFKYFSSGCSIDVMTYTISNLSGYFLLGKNEGNLLKTLNETNSNVFDKYTSLLIEKKDDKKFIDYFLNMRTRINSVLQNTASAYYKVFNEKLYISTNKAVVNEDSPSKNIAEFANMNDFITKIKLNLKEYITRSNEDKILTNKIATATNLKVSTVQDIYITVIKDNKKIDELVMAIFKTLGANLNNEVCSRNFVISNMRFLSSKYNDNELKPKIESIMQNSVNGYKSLSTNTQSRYRRTLVLLILLYIQKSNCKG